MAAFKGWEFSMQFGELSGEHVGVGVSGSTESAEGDAEMIPLHPGGELVADGPRGPGPSIDAVLAEFLSEQRQRLAASTYGRYQRIVELLRICLNNYGYQSLTGAEAERWRVAFDSGDEEAFTRLCGPQRIVENYGELLGYFMIRKVVASQGELKTAATVAKRLARWPALRGYIDARIARVDSGRDLAA